MAETGKASLKEALAYQPGTEAPAAPILKQVEVKTEGKKKFPGVMTGLVILVIGAGIVSGYGLSRLGGKAGLNRSRQSSHRQGVLPSVLPARCRPC